jgi:hypothetical protein
VDRQSRSRARRRFARGSAACSSKNRSTGQSTALPFTTLAWTGFNTSTKQYEATRISSTNPARIAESGTYDEAAKQFELKADYMMGADTWHQRTVIQTPSADGMIAASFLSFGAVPEWKAVEIKYTRRSK